MTIKNEFWKSPLWIVPISVLVISGCTLNGPNQPRFSSQAITFKEVDANQNGFITPDEFEYSPLNQAWEEIDTNGDGIVDDSEYRDAYGASALDLHRQ
ncbi:EF-hand domain-containing protein [Phytohalomonas tamaricis]|uniref:EF-hand domain-containing protein n=1 Tax=Phytohalomonas tamaricis TaxID=2081032 RepID=UPI000D0B55A0|nr:EF-hand domain-containing protein [Phytohalomonas tamaricis]